MGEGDDTEDELEEIEGVEELEPKKVLRLNNKEKIRKAQRTEIILKGDILGRVTDFLCLSATTAR